MVESSSHHRGTLMYNRSIILLILLISMFMVPAVTTARTAELVWSEDTDTVIGPSLKMEIASQSSGGASALLDFGHELTQSEVQMAEGFGITFHRRGTAVINVGRVYSAQVTNVESLESLRALGLLRATSGAKQYVPSIATSVPAIGADDVWYNLRADGQSINGSGTTIAVIDTGATWTHPSFWKPFPAVFDIIQSGPDYYLDLDGDAVADANEGPIRTHGGQTGSSISYGSDYMFLDLDDHGYYSFSQGDRWIGGIDENDDNIIQLGSENGVIMNVSKIAKFYDQYSGNVYVRGVNLTAATSVGDSNGHGTHVASTAAGGQPGFTNHVGVAPGADLIIIRSPLTSSAILDGISFAIENEVDVINMSFSSYLGFLDGSDLEDLAVNEAFLKYGILSTTAAGNLGNKQKHARFDIYSGVADSAIVDVTNAPDFSFLNILWHSDDRDEHVILSPPSGDDIDLGAFSAIADSAFIIDTPQLSAYAFCEVSLKGINNVIIQIQTDEHYWANGNWDVGLSNPTGETVTVDVFAWDGDWDRTNLEVVNRLDYAHSISSPGTADLAIAVAAFSEAGSSILTSSSKGPRVDGIPKPTVAAPGGSIYAALNSVSGLSLWTTKSGTSMASPHVAGLAALIQQASDGNNVWPVYSALIDGAGGIASHYDEASASWGYGLCDSVYSVMHVLDDALESGSAASEWIGAPELVSDPDDAVSVGLDILSVHSLLYRDALGIDVAMEGAVDFTGSNMLSIEWNTDGVGSTGVNGADLIVNITAGIAEVYEWTGSMYQLSTLSASYWNQSVHAFVYIQGLMQSVRGSARVSTHNSSMHYVDITADAVFEDYFRPTCESITLDFEEDWVNVTLQVNDLDSTIAGLAVSWSIIDGSLRIQESASTIGVSEILIGVDLTLVESEYANSLILNITADSEIYFSPPVPLSALAGARLEFTGGSLDADVVRVGFLMTGAISGDFSISGYNLASAVYVGFMYDITGQWLNFSLSSSNGLYEFRIVPSGFAPGEYGVYAIAIGRGVPDVEMQFATLSIVEDLTIVYVAIPLVVLVAAIYIFMRRRGGSAE